MILYWINRHAEVGFPKESLVPPKDVTLVKDGTLDAVITGPFIQKYEFPCGFGC